MHAGEPGSAREGERAPRERINVLLLAASWALFGVAAITVMTLSGLVGQRLAPTASLATAPVAAMTLGTVTATVPASLLMKRLGRRGGLLIGALAGATGGAVSVVGVAAASFVVFVAGNLLLGVYQAFAAYYRFAAADTASAAFRPRAVSLVLAGGVVAAFLGPANVRTAVDLLPVTEAGPYAVIVALALLAALLLAFLRIPGEQAALGGDQRPLAEVAAQPATRVAVAAGAVGYALMILVMTATPLAMRAQGFELADSATVMQWHVLGMFAPSFVTGHLIARFGVARVLLAGTGLMAAASLVAAAGVTFAHFWLALLLLGTGWNLLFIGGSTLLASTHTAAERGKVQGLNDLVVFSSVAVAALISGTVLHLASWSSLNLALLPVLAVTAAVILRWRSHDAATARALRPTG